MRYLHFSSLFILFCLVSFCSQAKAQKENIQWYSPSARADNIPSVSVLNFSKGIPVVTSFLPIGGLISSIFPLATYSNRTTGELLFFTDGNTIWNRERYPMPHGNFIVGFGTGERVMIVPMPGSISKFYVFGLGRSGPGFMFASWLAYSIVDMSLDSGRGDVIAHDVLLAGGTGIGGLSATWHANGCDVWLLAHSLVGNSFYSFLITPAGIDPVPVISQVGANEFYTYESTTYLDGSGPLMFNPQGDRVVSYDSGNIDLLHFNKRTGFLSNRILIPTNADLELPYFAFSPNGRRMYLSRGNSIGFDLSQFDLTSDDPNVIPATRVTIFPVVEHGISPMMQLGIDGKLYLGFGNNIAAIKQPDSLGIACAIDTAIIKLSPDSAVGTYQNIIESPLICPYHEGKCDTALMADFVQQETGCGEFCINLVDKSTLPATSWNWSMPGGHPSTSTLSTPHVCYDSAGIYSVTLIASGPAGSDTITKPVRVSVPSGFVTLKHETDTTVANDSDVTIPINYLPPTGFDPGGLGYGPGFDTIVYYLRMEIGISYDNTSLSLPLSEIATRIEPDSGWTVQSVDTSAGILRVTLADTGNIVYDTYIYFNFPDTVFHLGTYHFKAHSSQTVTSAIRLAYLHVETTESSYGFCDNLESSQIAKVIIQGSEGVSQTRNSLTCTIQPNPSSGVIHLVGMPGNKTEVSVYDLLGSEVLSQSIEFGEHRASLDLSKLRNGTYYLRLSESQQVLTKKFVLTR